MNNNQQDIDNYADFQPKTEDFIANPASKYEFERENADLLWIAHKMRFVRTEFAKSIIGQHELIELLLVGIFSDGHILLEGVPGVAKTLTAKVLARILDIHFSRIQFTPDLMPSDVIGTSIYNVKTNEFSFHKGPIFSNIVLIDEINRAPAKTQAALFEVMEERQITYDGTEYQLEEPFLVVATQNPIDHEGTYSLPEAQIDRFLFKIMVDHPSLQEEIDILMRYKNQPQTNDLSQINCVFSRQDLKKVQNIVNNTVIEEHLLQYIAQLIHNTRHHGAIYIGASPRASLALLKASKALAVIRGRDFVTPEDIQFLLPHVLNHRLILTPEAEMDGTTSHMIIQDIVQTVEVPR